MKLMLARMTSFNCLQEIKMCLEFLSHIYVDIFGFQFKLCLSTRPDDGYLGSIATWCFR